MFVGHYGVSFAAKSIARELPVWLLFVAAQAVDILWAIFVLLGVEKVRVAPGITASFPLDLYYMPYSHGLLAVAGWSALVFAACRFLPGRRCSTRSALILSAVVFSHWLLDVIVLPPNLPLYGDTLKIGLGLWNHPVPAFVLEAAVLFGGMWLYLRATATSSPVGRYGVVVSGLVMLSIQLANFFGPPPVSERAAALTGLVFFAVAAAAMPWLERRRTVVTKARWRPFAE